MVAADSLSAGLEKYFRALVLSRDITIIQDGYLIEFRQGEPEGVTGVEAAQVPINRLYLNQDLHDKQLYLWNRRFPEKPAAYRLIEPAAWRALPGMPPHLGAYFHDLKRYPLLKDQLRWLKRQRPRTHYRLLILAADGGLGDTLMKAVAYRHLMRVLAEYLPDFSVDFAAMTVGRPLKTDQLRQFAERQRILTAPVTVETLLEYDGLFDLTGALGDLQPEGPAFVDRLLHWLGLEPAEIPPEQKRNRIVIPRRVWREMASRLRVMVPEGRRRIVFSREASCRLRTMPQKAAAGFVRRLLDTFEDVHLLVPQPLAVSHPRLTVLGHLPTYHHLSALIGLSDGVITVESFAQHAADALGVPVVSLSASIDVASYFPYYPYMRGVMIPGAKKLPLYNHAVETERAWQQCASDYEAAWRRLDPVEVMGMLDAVPQSKPRARNLIWLEDCPAARGPLCPPQPAPVQRGVARPAWLRRAERWVLDWAEQQLYGNGKLIWVAPGDTPVTASVARVLGSGGHLTLYEPRRLMRQLQRALLARDNETAVTLHDHLPGVTPVMAVRHLVHRPQPTLQWGNSDMPDRVRTAPWQWSGALHGIIIYPPAEPAALLAQFAPVLSKGVVSVVLVAERLRALYPAGRSLQRWGYRLAVPAGHRDGVMLALSKNARLPAGWHVLSLPTQTRVHKERDTDVATA